MFNLFKKKKIYVDIPDRYVTCYLVCNRDDQIIYMDKKLIAKSLNRHALFLQERCARDFIKERNDKRLIIMVLQIPESDITFFPMNDITCECNTDINITQCYQKTIYP